MKKYYCGCGHAGQSQNRVNYGLSCNLVSFAGQLDTMIYHKHHRVSREDG